MPRTGYTKMFRSTFCAFTPVHQHRASHARVGGGDAPPVNGAAPRPPPAAQRRNIHPVFNGAICDENGIFLAEGTAPPFSANPDQTDWSPFASRAAFELAELVYTKIQMSEQNMDDLMEIWAATLVPHGARPPFANTKEMHSAIDSISHGDAPWQSFKVSYAGPTPESDAPSWMSKSHVVWFRDPLVLLRNMLKNTEFKGRTDYAPYQEFVDGMRKWCNFMSGNWSWRMYCD
ncbi:hypothetical protein BOTBODRAFT_177950 [Botryobasidium botryosum FD-172 SS1]|uniref:Uncharacterized protein n=1 Tax=Botryobasidium botryosum (strain FD-172 SS1) TaxID=930990 RepID=A0A067M517_BOTB1|nr:hypothetical protein BOTBODRAFT_177950 [Botryobasidium botryosum FD-172 SS1]